MKKAVKKQKTTKVVEKKSEISELRKLAYIFCVIVGVFLIFYGIAFMKAKNKTSLNDETRIIQYDEILISNLSKQSPDEYYVIVYKDFEVFRNLYIPYINAYVNLESPLQFYYSNLNDEFNKLYVTGTDNLKDVDNLRINDDVLFRIKNGQIADSYAGSDNIVKQLRTMNNKS